MAVAVGATVAFVPPFDTANVKHETTATVGKVNADRTVRVVADDANATPHDNVPVVAPGAPHPANGPFVIGELKGRARTPVKALKRKLPPAKKKAKK